MKNALKLLYAVTITVIMVCATAVYAGQSSFFKDFAGTVANVASQVSSLAGAENAAGNSVHSGDQPLPVAGNTAQASPRLSQSAGSSASTGYWGQTGMQGLKVYEYGKSLLSSQEQSVYEQIVSGLLSMNGSITVKTGIVPSSAEKVYEYCISDHPEVFYLKKVSMNYTYSQGIMGKTYKSYMFAFSYNYGQGEVSSMRNQLQTAARKMLSNESSSQTEEKKELEMHDALVADCSYNMQAVQSPDQYPESYTCYGALVNHSAVCEGYAKALKLLLDSSGVQSLYVTGKASSGGESGPHAWNMAQISGKWYYLDATFDDPVYRNAQGKYVSYSKPDYTYFNFTSKSDHVLGAFDESNPFSSSSENYAKMPSAG